jgi:hypothetical protein
MLAGSALPVTLPQTSLLASSIQQQIKLTQEENKMKLLSSDPTEPAKSEEVSISMDPKIKIIV